MPPVSETWGGRVRWARSRGIPLEVREGKKLGGRGGKKAGAMKAGLGAGAVRWELYGGLPLAQPRPSAPILVPADVCNLYSWTKYANQSNTAYEQSKVALEVSLEGERERLQIFSSASARIKTLALLKRKGERT